LIISETFHENHAEQSQGVEDLFSVLKLIQVLLLRYKYSRPIKLIDYSKIFEGPRTKSKKMKGNWATVEKF